MKLAINTKEKLIRLEESVNLGELFTQLEELLPDMKWREYTLEVNKIVKGKFHHITPTHFKPSIDQSNVIFICENDKTNIT